MSMTLEDCRKKVRSKLDEHTRRRWENFEIDEWINEGVREVSLRSRNLGTSATLSVSANNAVPAAIPTNILVIDDAIFTFTGSSLIYPLTVDQQRDMHWRWGQYRDTMPGIPNSLSIKGTAPTLSLILYPIPQSAGSLEFNYRRFSTDCVVDGSLLDIENGWETVAIHYATAQALIRAGLFSSANGYIQQYENMVASLSQFADENYSSQGRAMVPMNYRNQDNYW